MYNISGQYLSPPLFPSLPSVPELTINGEASVPPAVRAFRPVMHKISITLFHALKLPGIFLY